MANVRVFEPKPSRLRSKSQIVHKGLQVVTAATHAEREVAIQATLQWLQGAQRRQEEGRIQVQATNRSGHLKSRSSEKITSLSLDEVDVFVLRLCLSSNFIHLGDLNPPFDQSRRLSPPSALRVFHPWSMLGRRGNMGLDGSKFI